MDAPATPSQLAATPCGVGVMGDFFISHAKNAEFWDIEGPRFIGFAGGIALLNTGHVHPKVLAAIAAQLQSFTHSCYQVVPYTEYVTLAAVWHVDHHFGPHPCWAWPTAWWWCKAA